MSLTSMVGNFFGLDRGDSTRALQVQVAAQAANPVPPADQYALLRYYYAGNGVYERLSRALVESSVWGPARKGFRNPAQRIVEFYPAHLWPGALPAALPIVTPQREPGEGATAASAQDRRLLAAIHQVWTWSNWAQQKQVMARWLPMLGDCFLKVCAPQDTGRVYFELVDPAYVTAFETDARGYLTWVRIDVPIAAAADAATVGLDRQWSTEVWSKADQAYRRWVHQQPAATAVRQLGTPLDEIPFRAMGIDFVPIVHAQFRDVGEPRGVGAFTLAIDKIDEVNLKATRLAQQLFRSNANTWVLEGEGRDPAGRSQPPPAVMGRNGATAATAGSVVVGGEDMWSLPSGWHLQSLVPAIDFGASLNAIQADLLELQQDCPETAYWRISEHPGSELSGRAIRFMLGPAIARLLEVRGNAEDALARADAMALTLGQAAKLPGFTALGSYAAGDFAHSFQARDVVPLSDYEEAQTAQLMADASSKKLVAGWSQAQVFRDAGLGEAAIAQMMDEKARDDIIPTTAQ